MEREARLADLEQRLQSEGLSASERESLQAERTQLTEMLAGFETEADWTAEEAAEIHAMRRGLARSAIERWKLNRELYREFGGRIIFQQFGPEPLDAYRQFFKDRQREGAFTIHKQEFDAEFWRYFTDESIHSFFEPGSEAETQAFEVPPWEQFAAEE
jgi:hypothetical protein